MSNKDDLDIFTYLFIDIQLKISFFQTHELSLQVLNILLKSNIVK